MFSNIPEVSFLYNGVYGEVTTKSIKGRQRSPCWHFTDEIGSDEMSRFVQIMQLQCI